MKTFIFIEAVWQNKRDKMNNRNRLRHLSHLFFCKLYQLICHLWKKKLSSSFVNISYPHYHRMSPNCIAVQIYSYLGYFQASRNSFCFITQHLINPLLPVYTCYWSWAEDARLQIIQHVSPGCCVARAISLPPLPLVRYK